MKHYLKNQVSSYIYLVIYPLSKSTISLVIYPVRYPLSGQKRYPEYLPKQITNITYLVISNKYPIRSNMISSNHINIHTCIHIQNLVRYPESSQISRI